MIHSQETAIYQKKFVFRAHDNSISVDRRLNHGSQNEVERVNDVIGSNPKFETGFFNKYDMQRPDVHRDIHRDKFLTKTGFCGNTKTISKAKVTHDPEIVKSGRLF